MNGYSEYLVTRKKSVLDYAIMLVAAFSGVCSTVFIFPFLFAQLYGMFAFLAIAAIWYVIYIIIRSRTVEYEYCVTETVLDVDVITGKQKRKSFVSVDLKNADIIAPATVEYEQQFNKQGFVNKYMASMCDNNVLDFFVIYYDEKNNLCRLVFTPNQSVLDMIRKANPRNTFFE